MCSVQSAPAVILICTRRASFGTLAKGSSQAGRKVVRHGRRRADRDWCLQVRLATSTTSEDYVTGKLWECATLIACPWHPQGGCGFACHGTYGRVEPTGTRVARWYCPTARRTVSALPDCLASHRSGTLDECELIVRLVENAPSLSAACHDLRPEVQLPGILRFVTRLVRQITNALKGIKGLMPIRFTCQPRLCEIAALLDTSQVLMTLRDIAWRYLPQLPTPLGFNPHCKAVHIDKEPFQHGAGRDPPMAFVECGR